MTFYWLTPFADSFVNSDCLELVIYFRTNKQESEKNTFLVNFSDNSDLRRGFKESLHNFWEGERQKAIDMFFEVKGISVHSLKRPGALS